MSPEMKDCKEQLSRREREKLRHRLEIIEAATKVFAQKGFHVATLDEVAQEAEFSKGALYLHFSSKEDLLFSIVEHKMHHHTESFLAELNTEHHFKQVLSDMYKRMAELAFGDQDFFKLVMTQYANGYSVFSDENSAKLKEVHDKFWIKLLEIVDSAREKGELRVAESRSIIGLIHGSVDSMMMTRWGCDDLECLKNAVNSFIDILFNGIAKERETVQ